MPNRWRRMENAAKIFPTTSNSRDTKVFRFVCELYETVDPVVLQHALNKTLERFSFYRSVLKSGLFWFFFEETDLPALVREEYRSPCAPIYDSNRHGLLFQVTFYKKRINLELYHALSDGTGALQFIRTLVLYYLTEKHGDELVHELPQMDYDASAAQIGSDSFSKYYTKVKIRRSRDPKAYRIRGEKKPHVLGVIEGVLPLKDTLALAKARQVTLTEYLTAVLICAIHENMSLTEERKPVVVSIPVNLRNYFKSESSRNFFSVISVGHCFKTQGGTFEDVLHSVHDGFKQQLTAENIGAKMNLLISIEQNIASRLVPLALKIPSMKAAAWVAEQSITSALSNLGRVDMPAAVKDYIKQFGVFTGTSKLKICLCSYGDRLVISFTSLFLNTDIQRSFFRALTKEGLTVEINANIR